MKWNTSIANSATWTSEISNRAEKERVASRVASIAKNGDVIGGGSGSTAFLTLTYLGERILRERLDITIIPTSAEIALTCSAFGIPTSSLKAVRPDWSFDGADEVDPKSRLIKGRGGAMLLEKVLMACSPRPIIVVDNSKRVERLGTNFPIPVEVLPEAIHYVMEEISKLGATQVSLRMAKSKDGPVITESGNFILDARFRSIEDGLERSLASTVGVIESGLFIGYPVEVEFP